MNSNSWLIFWKTIDTIFYYFTWLIDAHVFEGLIIIQVHFDYLDSLFINRRKKWWGVYVIKKKAWQVVFDQV